MTNLIKKLYKSLKREGLRITIIKIIHFIFNQPTELHRVKNKILNKIIKKYNYSVAYGPFKNMKLSKQKLWSSYDLIPQTLGVYEQHVLEKLIEFSKDRNELFINIGAADGYFAIGMGYSKIFKKIYAYEISKIARENLINNVKNNFCQEIVHVKEEANYETLKDIIKNRNAVILIDIEGDEFNFFNNEMLYLMRSCCVICELHPCLIENGDERQNQLINNAKSLFDVSIIKRETYNPNQFIELDEFYDEERLLALGESRENNMKWLILKPKY